MSCMGINKKKWIIGYGSNYPAIQMRLHPGYPFLKSTAPVTGLP